MRLPWYRRTRRHVAATLVGAALLGVIAAEAYSAISGSRANGLETKSVTASTLDSAVTEWAPSGRKDSVRIEGTSLQGRRLSSSSLGGDVVVLNVWGSWCSPCRAEAPILAAASRRYAAHQVSFLGINVRDNAAAARAFEDRFEIPYPSIADFDGRSLLALNEYVPASAVPVTVILDREGRVAARVLGELREATLTALLRTVLQEPGPPPSSPS
jgi:thiol-disulfide isomerase/thioredoxin